MKNEKFSQAMQNLKKALNYEKKAAKDDFYFYGLSKSFEVALEYAWKALRQEAMEAGLEVPSPRDAIKQAAALGLIEDLDLWLEFLRVRSLALHDDLGVPRDEYIKTIKQFLMEGKRLLQQGANGGR